jgi:hypothetical protein
MLLVSALARVQGPWALEGGLAGTFAPLFPAHCLQRLLDAPLFALLDRRLRVVPLLLCVARSLRLLCAHLLSSLEFFGLVCLARCSWYRR